MSRSDYICILQSCSNKLKTEYGIKSLRLFGSVARGEDHEGSDVDVFVETETPNPFILMDAKDFLERLAKGLSIIGVEESMFTLTEEPVLMNKAEQMHVADHQKIVMIQNPDGRHVYEPAEAPCLYINHSRVSEDTRRHVPHIFPGKIWSTYILFHDNIQYGSWTVKLELSDFMFYYTVSLEMGSALRYLFLAME